MLIWNVSGQVIKIEIFKVITLKIRGMSDTGIITHAYTQVNGWKEMEQKVKIFLEKVGEKDLDAVLEKIHNLETELKKLSGNPKNWKEYFGNELGESDKKFYENFSKLPESSCRQIIEKINIIAERIAEKLEDEVSYVEENDGMTFIKFIEHDGGTMYYDYCVNIDDLGLTKDEETLIKNELEVYEYLEEKYREIW